MGTTRQKVEMEAGPSHSFWVVGSWQGPGNVPSWLGQWEQGPEAQDKRGLGKWPLTKQYKTIPAFQYLVQLYKDGLPALRKDGLLISVKVVALSTLAYL